MGIVSENEQAPVMDPVINSPQSEDDQDIVKKVNELLTRSKRHRKRYDGDWHYNYEFVCNGRQWPVDRPRWRFNEVVNLTWSTIMTEIAIQTDSRPKFEFNAQEYTDEAFVDVLRDVNDRNWDKYKWSSVIQDALFDCKIYHVGHAIVEWNPDMEYAMGDIDFRMLDPYYCYWDPRASDVNKGRPARWFIYAEPVPTSELKLKYPQFEEKIKSDVSLMSERMDWASQTGRIYTNFDPYSPTRLPSASGGQGEKYGGEPLTVLIRCWMRDETMDELCEEFDETNPETGEKRKEYVLQKRFPKGRYVEIASNLKLRDAAPGIEIDGEWHEYEQDNGFPIARIVNYQYPREYAGENEITHTKGPQKVNNYIWSYILDMFRMQANPITVIGDSGDIDEETITNEPGNIIKAADINQIRREPGTPITPGSFDLLTQGNNFFDKIQGLQDVSRGAQMANVNSGIMLEGYVEAAQTRPRMKNRNLDNFLQDAGELIVKRMLQFYTQPRMFRITNKDGFPEFIEFYVPTVVQTGPNGQPLMGPDGKPKTIKVAKIRRVSTIDGTPVAAVQQNVEVKGIPDLRVTSGSALPYAKAQKAQTAMSYFNAGAIDQEELLKAVDWPNWQEVLKRMQKAAADAAQAKMQAEQQAAKGKAQAQEQAEQH